MLVGKRILVAFAFLSTLFLAAQFFATNANAEGKGSMYEKNYQSVETVTRLPHESYVTLQGYLVESHGDEKYTLKDDTGTIVVEIDDDKWTGPVAGPQDLIEVSGELKNEPGELLVDVKQVTKK